MCKFLCYCKISLMNYYFLMNYHIFQSISLKILLYGYYYKKKNKDKSTIYLTVRIS